MKQVGDANQINVLAQFDRAGSRGETIRYCLQQGTPLSQDAVQEYRRPYDEYCDLLDLCHLLERHLDDAEVQAACAQVRQAAEAIVTTGFKGAAVGGSQGISIYFPKRKLSPLYKDPGFPQSQLGMSS